MPATRNVRVSVPFLTSSVETLITFTTFELKVTAFPDASNPFSPSYTGTSFMPQMVQFPGWSDLIHGCIGLW